MTDGIPKNIEDADTSPIRVEKTSVTFESVEVGAGERGEIILSLEKAMRKPVLYLRTDRHSAVMVEQILHSNIPIFDEGNTHIDKFQYGYLLNVTVTSNEPVKIVFQNQGKSKITVSACLALEGERVPVPYRLLRKEIEE